MVGLNNKKKDILFYIYVLQISYSLSENLITYFFC